MDRPILGCQQTKCGEMTACWASDSSGTTGKPAQVPMLPSYCHWCPYKRADADIQVDARR